MGQTKGYVDVPLSPQQRTPAAQSYEDAPISAKPAPTPERGWMDELADAGREFYRTSALNVPGAVQGVAEAVRHPIDTAKGIGAAQGELAAKAEESFKAGDYITGSRHLINYLLPLIGPGLDAAGDKGAEGKYGEMVGGALGLGTSIVGPQIVKAGAGAVQTGAQRLGKAADAGATARVVDVMVPKLGPNKRKFGTMAVDVAPTVARETTAVTRGGLLEQAATKLDDANAALEAAYDAVPTRRTYATQPIKDAIDVAIKNLSVSGTGGTVEPATRAARLAALKQARTEVDALGGVTNLPNLRKLRQSWDEGAKAVFTPDAAADAFKLKAEGHGWADARTAVSDYMGSKHPELKPLNADVSLWIKASDVMQAAEDIERVRPTVGRNLMARGLGAATGAAGGGAGGAITGAVVGPLVERLVSNTHPAMKMIVARQMARLADALRAGHHAKAASLVKGLETMVPATAAVNAVRDSSLAVVPKAAGQPEERRP